MPNIQVRIHKHNKSIVEKAQQKNPGTQLCKYTNKKQRLLDGQYLTESIVYQAKIKANIPGYKEKVYLGLSKTTFKIRYGNNKKLFPKQHHKNNTELSKEY